MPHKREEKFCIPFRFFNVRLASLSCGQNTGFRRIKRRNPVFLYTENRCFYVKSVKTGTKTGIKNRSKTWKNLCLSLALVSLVLSEVSIQGSRNGGNGRGGVCVLGVRAAKTPTPIVFAPFKALLKPCLNRKNCSIALFVGRNEIVCFLGDVFRNFRFKKLLCLRARVFGRRNIIIILEIIYQLLTDIES